MPAILHSSEVIVEANGIKLCYDTFGDRDRPALLLIMGLGAQMVAWDSNFCEQLASRGYFVIRFDNRDVGKSERMTAAGVPDVTAALEAAARGASVRAPYLLSDMAADAVGLLDILKVDRAHIVGASMGGAIAQEIAIRHPSRTISLTSIMATTGAPGLPPPTPEALGVLFKPAPADKAAYLLNYRQTWAVLRGPGFPLDEACDLERAERYYQRGLSPEGFARQLVAIVASGSRREALRAVRVPTLVIHGDSDPLVPLGCGIDTASAVTAAKLLVIKRMGHALPISMWGEIIDGIAQHAV